MIQINGKELNDSLKEIKPYLLKNTSVGILEYLKLNIKENELSLSATNNDHYFIKKINILNEQNIEKELCIKLVDITKISDKYKKSDLYFDIKDDNSIVITNDFDKFNFKIYYVDSDEFPDQSNENFDYDFTLNSNEFVRAFNKVSFAMSDNIIKPVFNALCVSFANDNISFVTTDSRRLSIYKIKQHDLEKKENILIQRDTISKINNTIKSLKSEFDIKCSVGAYIIKFEFENVEIYSRLVDGQFPTYERVIPDYSEHKMIYFTKEEMLSTIKTFSEFSREPAYKIICGMSENSFDIDCSIPEKGDISYSFDISKKEKNEFIEYVFALNSKMLYENINVLDKGFYFNYTDSLSPVCIIENNHTSVLMPIKIKNYVEEDNE